MQTVALRLNDKTIARVDALAIKQSKTRSEIIRDIVSDYFGRNKERTLNELNQQINNYLPDLKEQIQAFRELRRSSNEMIEKHHELQSYLADTKKGERYYSQQTFKAVKQLIEALAGKIKAEKADEDFDIVAMVRKQAKLD